jgi:hypothetical protein
MKRLKITESQLQRLLQTEETGKLSLSTVVEELKTSFNCGANHSGASIKGLVSEMMRDYGFEDVVVNFLKRDSNKNMVYVVYTKETILTITTESGIDANDKPCLSVIDVDLYNKLTQ